MYGKPKPDKPRGIPGPGEYKPTSIYKPLGGTIQKTGRADDLIQVE